MSKTRLILLAAIYTAIAFAQSGSSNVVISQVYGGGGNSGATLRNDFVELFNRSKSPVSLDGWSVQYASATGETWQVSPLSGSIQPGRYFLVQQAAGAGGTESLPAPDATGSLALGGTAGKIALVRVATPSTGTRPSADVVDLVGYGAANGFEGTGPTGTLSNTTAAARRGAGCTDTDNNTADFQVAAPAPRNSAAPAVDCDAPRPVPVSLTISQVQGSGAESPYKGQLVRVRGVVTGTRSNGVWIQSTPDLEDNSPETSEGIFVFASPFPAPTPSVGALIEVTGTVTEFRPASDPTSAPLTEVIEPEVTVVGSAAVPNARPLPPDGDWERFEGMRVAALVRTVSGTLGSVNEPNATSTSNGVFYGVHTEAPRPFRDATGIDDSFRLRVDSRGSGQPALDVTTGQSASVRGLLDFAFRTYSIYADGPTLIFNEPLQARPISAAAANEFKVASMNLERIFDQTDDPGTQDPVLTAAAFRTRIDRAARVIRETLASPEIIGVQEVENIDTLRALATAAGDYDAHLLEGNDIGGIDVGVLVRRSRVQVVDVTQEGKDVRQVDNSILNDRPPLAVRVRVDNIPITVIVVHQRSLIDVGTPNVDRKRRGQAEFLRDRIAARIASGEEVLVLGDFNMFQFDPLMDILKSSGNLTNLTDTVALSESYSYILDGTAQTLDHILISPGLRSRFTRFEFARVNADFPESYRNTRLERISDHDHPVGFFTTEPTSLRVTAAGVTNAATNLSSPVSPNQLVTIYGRGIGPTTAAQPAAGAVPPATLGGTRVLFDGAEAPLSYAQASQVNVIVQGSVAGKSTVVITVEVQGQTVASTTVRVAASEPGIFTFNGSGRGQAAVLNQNFSVNGPANPATRGSVIMIYATGGGERPNAQVRIGGQVAEVQYSGQAPGLLPGALQINARVPMDVAPGDAVPISISFGGRPSQLGVTIAVR